jgi:hypothetical protein
MTVPDAGHFALENGAVVHNCDALRYLAVVWRQEFTRPDLAQPIKYQSSF